MLIHVESMQKGEKMSRHAIDSKPTRLYKKSSKLDALTRSLKKSKLTKADKRVRAVKDNRRLREQEREHGKKKGLATSFESWQSANPHSGASASFRQTNTHGKKFLTKAK